MSFAQEVAGCTPRTVASTPGRVQPSLPLAVLLHVWKYPALSHRENNSAFGIGRTHGECQPRKREKARCWQQQQQREQAAGSGACSRVVGGSGGQQQAGTGTGTGGREWMAGRRAGAAGRSSSRQRVVNQPSASVTEPGVCSKELQRGESFLLMKETSVLIESGSSPAARDRPRQLIHISCFAPLQQDKGQCKRWGSPARPW